MFYERVIKVKILKFIILIILLVGCGYSGNVQTKIQQKDETAKVQSHWEYYQEFSNIFEAASKKCGNSDIYYFEDVEVVHIDRKKNRLLVTIRNSHKKRYSAFIQYEQLPTIIPKKIHVVVGSFVKESFPPILDGKEIHHQDCK